MSKSKMSKWFCVAAVLVLCSVVGCPGPTPGPCDGVLCDDGDPCTLDTCVAGECVGTPVECPEGQVCHTDTGECGDCLDDADCDDGDACTSDTCDGGACALVPIDCPEGQVCQSGECVDEEPDGGEPGPTPTGETLTLDLGDGVTMELVRIPAGTFMMGTDSTDYSWLEQSRPVHNVTISQDFYIGQYEVTQAQWKAVMGTSPWAGQRYVLEQGDCPATYVSWDDVVQFCQTLSASTGYDMRLPSEAEWEYTTRAGTTTEYSFGDSSAQLSDYAWWDANADNVGEDYAHPVGQKLPNPWGLYDMHGNAWDWCSDWYDGGYYGVSPSTDPKGPSSGTYRVLRGGSWYDYDNRLRSANRYRFTPDAHNGYLGFRCVAGT